MPKIIQTTYSEHKLTLTLTYSEHKLTFSWLFNCALLFRTFIPSKTVYKIACGWEDGRSTVLSLLVALTTPTSGSSPARPCTPIICCYHSGLWAGENHTSWPCDVLCKNKVYRHKDESLKNFPAEWGAQIWLRGIWTKVLPGERSFLAYFGLLS